LYDVMSRDCALDNGGSSKQRMQEF